MIESESWADLSIKTLSNYDVKTARNVVGAMKWQMEYLHIATESRDKTSRKYRPDIKRFFVTQTDRIIEKYNEHFSIKSEALFPIEDVDRVVDFILPASEEFLLKAEMRPMHTSALQKSVTDINGLMTTGAAVSSSISNQYIVSKLSELSTKIGRIHKSTKDIIRSIIIDGISKGENIVDIRERIRETGINEYYQGRSLAIARTETRAAYDAGGRVAYGQIGIKNFDVVGCRGTFKGVNALGLTAAYGDFSENAGSCGVLGVDFNLWDAVSNEHHINHNGVMVTSDRL